MEESHEEKEERKIVDVPIDKINVPRERVTSVWSPEIEEEFIESIRAKGILKPLDIMEVDGQLWLVDGLHRLTAAEKLNFKTVPCIIKKGSIEDLLITNIIVNRQRGKSNPAQEAECLAFLVHKRGFPLENAAKQLGFSLNWAKKLLRVAQLPEEIKDYIKQGKLPITGAFHLTNLPSTTEQITVARDAVTYNYNAYQIKARVAQLLNPDIEPEAGEYTFTPKGEPKKIPIRCEFCGTELPEAGRHYRWMCSECEPLLFDLYRGYQKALQQATQQQPQPNP